MWSIANELLKKFQIWARYGSQNLKIWNFCTLKFNLSSWQSCQHHVLRPHRVLGYESNLGICILWCKTIMNEDLRGEMYLPISLLIYLGFPPSYFPWSWPTLHVEMYTYNKCICESMCPKYTHTVSDLRKTRDRSLSRYPSCPYAWVLYRLVVIV